MATGEEAIIARYSTVGLKRNVLDRFAKRMQLDGLGVHADERDEILNALYGEEPAATGAKEP
jgi:hypothetical protein